MNPNIVRLEKQAERQKKPSTMAGLEPFRATLREVKRGGLSPVRNVARSRQTCQQPVVAQCWVGGGSTMICSIDWYRSIHASLVSGTSLPVDICSSVESSASQKLR